MTDEEAVALFAALANDARLAMLRRLVQAGPTGISAGEIAASVGASPSRASFHLAALTEVGLIQSRREARKMIYTIDFNRMGALAAYLLHDCCRGAPEVRACCGLPSEEELN